MKKVFKYTLEIASSQSLILPIDAEILTVQSQHIKPVLYALIDSEQTGKTEKNIEVFGTGHSIDYSEGQERKYIGTFQTDGGYYVFHVFERI